MTKTKYTENTIKVTPLDMDKLNVEFDKSLNKPNKEYHAIGQFGIIFEPKLSFIDNECVGNDATNAGDKIEFMLYEHDLVANTHNCLPTYSIKLTIDELKPFFKEPITLKEFMAERYNYNSRIIGNLQSWLNHFNT